MKQYCKDFINNVNYSKLFETIEEQLFIDWKLAKTVEEREEIAHLIQYKQKFKARLQAIATDF